MRTAVFLDRDGVLNRAVVRAGKPYPPDSPEDLEILPGTAECLSRLKHLGFLLLVVTNQPDVARGTQTRASVDEMNGRLCRELPLDEVLTCFHDDRDQCACRKPAPGLLLEAAARYGIDLARSFMIGDRWRDIDAGHAAGCRTIWIDYQYRERGPSAEPSFRAASLREATDWIEAHIQTGVGSAIN